MIKGINHVPSNTRYYAGIGSRSTPTKVQCLMTQFSSLLELDNFILRSGGAPGADSSFEAGTCNNEIYIPWHFYERRIMLYPIIPEAIEIAAKCHPAWLTLSEPVKLLMARNTMQVLGEDCHTPSEFVICWTKDGVTDGKKTTRITGGTGQAIRVATAYNVPVYNLNTKDLKQLFVTMGNELNIDSLKRGTEWPL